MVNLQLSSLGVCLGAAHCYEMLGIDSVNQQKLNDEHNFIQGSFFTFCKKSRQRARTTISADFVLEQVQWQRSDNDVPITLKPQSVANAYHFRGKIICFGSKMKMFQQLQFQIMFSHLYGTKYRGNYVAITQMEHAEYFWG